MKIPGQSPREGRTELEPPEWRFSVGVWLDTRVNVVIGAFWLPREREIWELRGCVVSTVATTAAEDADDMTAEWSADCPYSERRKAEIGRELCRLHERLRDARVCEG